MTSEHLQAIKEEIEDAVDDALEYWQSACDSDVRSWLPAEQQSAEYKEGAANVLKYEALAAKLPKLFEYVALLEGQVQKWISVKERLPGDEDVLLLNDDGVTFGCSLVGGGFLDYVNTVNGLPHPIKGVTHWQNLPAPPSMNGEK